MNGSKLDQELIRLKAYEPAGVELSMSARDLLGHTLVLGGSGAGKTTCIIQPILNQLIKSTTSCAVGICMLDTKADGEAYGFLKQTVLSAECAPNFSCVSETSDYCLDLLEPLREERFQGASKLAETLGYIIPECSANRYWEVMFRAMLRHTLRLFLLLGREIDYKNFVEFISDYLLRFDTDEGSFSKLDMLLETQYEDGVIKAPKAVVHEARSMHRMWEKLDWGTRTNLQSMAAPLVSVLNSELAEKLFCEGEPVCMADALAKSDIVLLSIDAVREPELSKLVSTIFKARYYDTILSRRSEDMNPIAILVMDDWVQSATAGSGSRYSDADALSLIRSRNGCILAAAQGLSLLDLVIGPYSRRAVLTNFANIFFFRSRDAELDVIASAYLGEVKQTMKDIARFDKISPSQRRSSPVEYIREVTVPAVPPGKLARLPTGEAYALIGGEAYKQPISFIPYHSIKEDLT